MITNQIIRDNIVLIQRICRLTQKISFYYTSMFFKQFEKW